jgi:hypothetical protein
MKKTILFFCIILFSTIAKSQSDFRPGYLIKANGDTVSGLIDYRGDLMMGNICRFKADANSSVTEYKPVDISAYRFTDSKYFVSKNINGQDVFLEYLINGKLSIFYLRNEKGDHFYIKKDTSGIVELPYEEAIKTVGDKSHLVKTTKHIGILSLYMHDAPDMKMRISNMKTPEYKSLINLAKDYHNKVCKDEACIIYEKNMPSVKTKIELGSSVLNFSKKEFDNYKFNNSLNIFYSLNIYLWMPRTSERFYISTGLTFGMLEGYKVTEKRYFSEEKGYFSVKTYEESDLSIIKIPLRFTYAYPSGIVKPVLSYGICFNAYGFSSFAEAGLDFQLLKSLELSVKGYYEYNNIVIPAETVGFGGMIGLKYCL